MCKKISDQISLRPRYGEVDQMGYVYHANYVNYCHQARTELLRKFDIDDRKLEQSNIMLPVISMNLRYLKPAKFDELLNIKTSISELPKTRFNFEFEIRNEENVLLCTANSSLVFVNSISRKPMRVPKQITQVLKNYLEQK